MSDIAHPRLVALAREAKGWSQERLAEGAGLSQGYISKVESGVLTLEQDNLARVARSLNVPVALLTDATPVQGLEVTCLHHRRRHSKMTAATKRGIEAVTHLTRISVEGMLHGIELLPEVVLRPMDIDEYGDPAAIARAVRVAWRVPSGPIGNVIGLLESVGIIVVVRPLGTAAQDAVSSWPHDRDHTPIMVVNVGLSPDRQRFTISHELGHLLMHAVPSEDQEAQANSFASELLAPAAEIEPQLAGLTTRDFPRLLELKSYWGLSVAALIRRAKDLRVISDRQYREFQIKLRTLGWYDTEPNTLPTERPATMHRIMSVHLDEHGYTVEELARAAVMNPGPFTRHWRPTTADTPATRLRLLPP